MAGGDKSTQAQFDEFLFDKPEYCGSAMVFAPAKVEGETLSDFMSKTYPSAFSSNATALAAVGEGEEAKASSRARVPAQVVTTADGCELTQKLCAIFNCIEDHEAAFA